MRESGGQQARGISCGGQKVASSSKRVKLEIMGPVEGEDEFLGNSESFLLWLIGC